MGDSLAVAFPGVPGPGPGPGARYARLPVAECPVGHVSPASPVCAEHPAYAETFVNYVSVPG
jgi:hypothetical protein